MKKSVLSLLLVFALMAGILLLPGCGANTPENPGPDAPPSSSDVPPSSSDVPPSSSEVPPSSSDVPPSSSDVPPSSSEIPPSSSEVPPSSSETPPVTPPPAGSDDEPIGSLYTRSELMALENVKKGYGPGTSKNGVRPSNAVNNQTAYGKYNTHFIGPDDKNVYLTFDCGYEYTDPVTGVRQTEKILDVLKEKNVKAVFFVTKWYCVSAEDLVQRMIDEGHIVGNHTSNHPSMPSVSLDKNVEEVMSLHNYVKEKFGYTMTYFRPPSGEFSSRVLALVQSLGYKTVYWSFAYADWDTTKQMDIDTARSKILDSAHNGAIYLLHAVSTTNATLMGDIIDGLIEKGYTLKLF